ncbi:putative RNA polymerase II subunit B1 CTD phosphatase rpap2 isoform X1 [Octopus bimaculoides]|uniref:putative RNA polymerase II subunit B1 CTD phosphatase rpap2 isoform X1 n=2 Tax=Octopus bimaculoides TaxID=37653 RepID=UPI00071CE55F|nr:putative RNA polymerase II subunit B1 CTD phosphatase rpap2 isoform X1 [Octopus bimaculoides]|eukprot:XP_014784302.1 PREDICTED: putative RNA polymerase II subunit B1 CTD phosphatase rpap2 isoform X2 [Octopus bimaculoides]
MPTRRSFGFAHLKIRQDCHGWNAFDQRKEMEEQVRKRVASEERAFRIVMKLVEETVTFEQLKDMAHFLMPNHYHDICEERAIVKLCAYPICANNLPNTKPSKYHISTKTNKVYDITERKIFCSNRCFKHSKIFEKQILTSPLWFRPKEKPADFRVPDTENDKGWVGYEVISKKSNVFNKTNISEEDTIIDAEEEEDSRGVVSILDQQDWLDELHDNLYRPQPNISKLSTKDSDIEEDPLQHVNYEDGSDGDFLQSEGSDEENGSSTDKRILERLQGNLSELGNFYSDETDSDDDKTSVTLVTTSRKKKTEVPKKGKSCQPHLLSASEVSNNKTKSTEPHSQINQLQMLLDKQKNKLSQFVNPVSLVNNEPESQRTNKEGNYICRHHSSDSQTSDTVTVCSNSSPSTKDNSKSSNVSNNTNHQRPRDKIINFVHSWITPKSLSFLGLSSSEEQPDPSNDSASKATSDFSKLCERVAIQGQDFELLLDDHVPGKDILPKKSLPSYENLQKETENYSFKVKEYFKPPPKKKIDENESSLVLPNVDSYSQVTLRRSIFLQQLGKRIDALISGMDLLIGELSTDIKDFVHTFSLVNTNIVLKTREWDIAAIFIIILLSKKTAKLETGLQKPNIRKKFNNILQKFDLSLLEAQTLVAEKLLVL